MAEKKHDAAGAWNQQLWTFVVLALLVGATLGFVVGSRGGADDVSGGAVAIAQPLKYNVAKQYLGEGGYYAFFGGITHTPPFETEVYVNCPAGTSSVVYGGCGEPGMIYAGIPVYLTQTRFVGGANGPGWYCSYLVASPFPPEFGYNAFNTTYIAAHVYCK
ncbi:hypothetical protein HZB01_03290 [Candidatus Woesearchaeota archaeon]|nr:hypothetical protein [Candidatus Woesearchaeota archaeon]